MQTKYEKTSRQTTSQKTKKEAPFTLTQLFLFGLCINLLILYSFPKLSP